MLTNKYKSTAEVVFDPLPLTGKVEKMFKPFWVILRTHDDIDDYYRWFLKKRYNLILQAPAWGPHISVVRGTPIDKQLWEKYKQEYNGKEIEFEYENFIKSNSTHWWLKVYSDEVIELRRKLQLPEKVDYSFHLTLGLPIPLHEEHSKYVFNTEMNYKEF